MAKALSEDLRERVVAAVDAGATHRQASERFEVSAASVSRWGLLKRSTGTVVPGPLGGDRRSGRIEAHAALILSLYESRRDITLAEIREELAKADVAVSIASVWRFFDRRGLTVKKSRRMRPNRNAPTS
jgi:transposase